MTYGYDGSLHKDVTWSGPISGNVHKTYDSSFRLASESVTGGQTISFSYDNDDLITSAGAMTITRDPATGFVTGTTLGPRASGADGGLDPRGPPHEEGGWCVRSSPMASRMSCRFASEIRPG
jgi:hypothetical protein